jgi:outer membrane protein TolC
MRIKPVIILALGLALSASTAAQTVLTVERAREMALTNNRQYLSAKQELNRAQGNIISARSGALPQLSLSGGYTRYLKPQEAFFAGQKIQISQDNEYSAYLSLTQPLYVGGKVGAALAVAKVYRKYAEEKVREAEASIIFGAEAMFFETALAGANLEVLQKAYDQLNLNLEIVEKYYQKGLISEYELLRARVEKANIEPKLIAAESQVNMTAKKLKSYLGMSLEDSVIIAADLSDTAEVETPSLDSLVKLGLQLRPEVKQAEYQKQAYDKAVNIAKGDWLLPTVGAGITYGVSASSNNFRLGKDNVSNTLFASLSLNIPLFDGARTIGEVRKAKVDYYQAVLKEEQTRDEVRLEVEQAYDNLKLARRALEAQRETIAQAEEGMRIANLRYQSGVGTQLEVLSAQTALTDARTNFVQAIYNYRLAKSGLKKAAGFDFAQ